MSDVTATAYLTVQGIRSRHGDKTVRQAKITRITQSRPSSLALDQIAVRVMVQLPSAAFEPLRPEALIVVPEEMIQFPVEVEASPANPAVVEPV